MNQNIMQLLSAAMNSGNPQSFVLNYIQGQMGNNPIFNQLIALGQKGEYNQLNQVARNILQQQGYNFDEEFTRFKNNFKL